MKKILSKHIKLAALVVSLGCITSCTKDFGSINTNPSITTTPDVKYLLSYSEDQLATYQSNEWVWEGMEQLWRFTQHITSDPYEITSNVNSRYGAFYSSILPNLFEIRRQISLKTDKDSYQKMAAVTHVIQVLQAIKVTDMNGSIPYSQAEQGRYNSNYSPVYDKQPDLLTALHKELNDAIAILESSTLPAQLSYGTNDIYYASDWTKWTMLANTLKLRIAARLENQNNATTQAIFQEVMSDAIGPISNDAAQFSYSSPNYAGPYAIDYRSSRYATVSIMKFLKTASDPRLPVYFAKNDLVGSYQDSLTKYSTTLPAFINTSDPLIAYQGGPADWTVDPTTAAYIKNPFSVGNTTSPGNTVSNLFLISRINRKFLAPRYDNSTVGVFTDVMVTNAESCLLVAEFIAKGYAGSVNTNGSAQVWYNKAITSSISTMNTIAIAANSTTPYSGDGSTVIAAYLNNPAVQLGNGNDLERIYIQEYLNYFRNPTEGFVFCRRTGYPKKASAYYPRETFNETIPRRWWTTDPGEVNRVNWTSAMTDQGFTPNAQDLPTLSTQRIWYDKTAPDFGGGN